MVKPASAPSRHRSAIASVALSEAGVSETAAVTLVEIMAGNSHYNIDSKRVRAHVSAAGRKRGTSTRSWPLVGWDYQYASLPD